MTYEEWFEQQDFYANMRYAHGDKLFIKDNDVYRVLPVQIGYKAWNKDKATAEVLKPKRTLNINIYAERFTDIMHIDWFTVGYQHTDGEWYRGRSSDSFKKAVDNLKNLLEDKLGYEIVVDKIVHRNHAQH